MDPRRIRRQQPSPANLHDSEISEGVYRAESEEKPSSVFQRPAIILSTFILILLPFILVLSNRSPSLETLCKAGRVVETAGYEAKAKQGSENGSLASSNITEGNFLQKNITKDILLGGLLVPGFDQGSCLSRYQSVLYRKESPHLPSPHLLERLRKQEALQKKCGPGTQLYKKAIEQLKSGNSTQTLECNYLVVLSYSGLGNKMLTLASAFIYAILTNRVLLIDRGAHIADLFCEPFPNTTWLLPWDFPIDHFSSIYKDDPRSYGKMLKDKVIGNEVNGATNGSLPPYVYLHLSHDYGDFDKLFYCEDDQRLLQKIPWLLLRSNQYFVPSLFLIPAYEEELNRLFPEKETAFHHLGRYLFHPTNSVWGMIVRSYQAYLAKADEIVGIQVRVFERGKTPFQHVLDQILACSLEEKVLPNVSLHEPVVSGTDSKSKVVLVTSLDSAYFEKIRSMYWEHSTATGEVIGVYQPSHEGFEQTGKEMHEMKAWAEIYLLSLTDMLVSSSWSTFGYVARGLGGLKPWIVSFKTADQMTNPPCRRAMSMDPCFHFPPFLDCKAKSYVDQGALVPYLKHCEDSGGLKLVDPVEQ
ncbi:galactoside 2-alpha-L-fucosyltransferase-like [Phoenix dactylifera]|uniref:Fucosyltransferase n=1 Tax=Phoenix dactylifera TaxID=42345 RepID=A0A8B7BF44_PHODC|nr:galactoside 2-alpha-L-fucosyltransferase-like [Phoenix dactylifera]